MNTYQIFWGIVDLLPYLVIAALALMVWGTVQGLVIYSKTKSDTMLLVLGVVNLISTLFPVVSLAITYIDISYDEIIPEILPIISILIAMVLSLNLFFSYIPGKYGKTKAYTIYGTATVVFIVLVIFLSWLELQQTSYGYPNNVHTTAPPNFVPPQVNQ